MKYIKKYITTIDKLLILEEHFDIVFKDNNNICIVISNEVDINDIKKVLKEFLKNEYEDIIIYHLILNDNSQKNTIDYFFNELFIGIELNLLPTFLLFKDQKLYSKFFGLLSNN